MKTRIWEVYEKFCFKVSKVLTFVSHVDTLIRQGGLWAWCKNMFDQIFCVNQFACIDVFNLERNLEISKTFCWHFSVLLLSLIRQERFVAKCQDIWMGNPPSGREGKEGCPPHFYTSIHLHLPTSKFQLLSYFFILYKMLHTQPVLTSSSDCFFSVV